MFPSALPAASGLCRPFPSSQFGAQHTQSSHGIDAPANVGCSTSKLINQSMTVLRVEQRFRAAFEKPSRVSSPREPALFACERSRGVEEL